MKALIVTISLILIGLFYFNFRKFNAISVQQNELKRQLTLTENKSFVAETFPKESKSIRISGDEVPVGAITNERLVSFSSEEDMQEFLKKIKNSDLRVLLESQRGLFLRVRFKSLKDLQRLLSGSETLSFNYSFPVEPIPDGQINPNVVGFGDSLKEWMRIYKDNSDWGAGVKVFVLDTGISNHPIFEGRVNTFSVLGDNLGSPHPHGDSMVSLWLSADGEIPAISPAVDLNSVRVSGVDGISDTASISEGIYLAVAEGAQVITISLGGPGDSTVLKNAVKFTTENGVLVIASAGNSGTDIPFFPAAYESVYSVTTVDAYGAYSGFGNTGDSIDLAMPGISMTALNREGEIAPSSTGTSPSAQVFGATVAAVMSEMGWDALKSADFVRQNAHDVGAVGFDNLFGNGAPRVGTVLDSLTGDIYDAAVMVPQIVIDRDGNPNIIAGVDNPGTEPLEGATLEVVVNGDRYELLLGDLPAKDSIGVRVPTPVDIAPGQPLRIELKATLSDNQEDIYPRDNQIITTISLRAQ